MTFKQAIKSSLWDKYSTFEGRASRREYWYFVLCCVSVRICVEIFLGTWFSTSLVEKVLGGTHRFYLLGTLGTLINIALILPLLAVGVRRSQDFGLSGRLYLGVLLGSIAFAVIVLNSPILGAFTSLLFAVYVGLRKGDTYQNRYGDVPTTSHDPVPETSETGSRRLIGQLCIGIGLLAALDLTLGYLVNDTEASNAPSYAEMIGQKTVLFEPGSTRYSEGTDSLIWAFNFPIGMNVDPVLAVNDAIVGFDADRPVVTIRDGFRVFRPIMERRLQSIENSSTPVRLLFSLPDFGNVQGEFDDQPTSSLHVTLQPEPRRYATQKDWGTSPSFMDEVEKTDPIRMCDRRRDCTRYRTVSRAYVGGVRKHTATP
ncbi:DUF805 domain-containing protein [Yoonia maritima]|uniref:DUF805 domain-containing protein n=1 Tax=Yoonia maritima TaxID=1435347 RepID=UPI0013A62C04|nr:DUF805 domain-containing protein [Yoonia maritima]